jgi:hypothetical protein
MSVRPNGFYMVVFRSRDNPLVNSICEFMFYNDVISMMNGGNLGSTDETQSQQTLTTAFSRAGSILLGRVDASLIGIYEFSLYFMGAGL